VVGKNASAPRPPPGRPPVAPAAHAAPGLSPDPGAASAAGRGALAAAAAAPAPTTSTIAVSAFAQSAATPAAGDEPEAEQSWRGHSRSAGAPVLLFVCQSISRLHRLLQQAYRAGAVHVSSTPGVIGL